jgi:hypothetical protein
MIATLSNGQYTITKISRDLFQRGDKVKKVEEKTIEQEVKIEPDVERYEVPASSQFSRGFDSIDAAISAEGLKYSETHPESQYAIVSFLMYTFIAEKIDETWYSIDTDGKHVRAPDAHRSLQKALEEKRKPPQESVPQTDDVPVPEPSKKPKTMNIGSNICASNIGWFDNINALTASIGPNLEQTRKDLKPKDHLNCFTVVYMKHQPFIVQYVDGWIAVDTEGNEVKHITDSQSSLRKFMVGEYVL